MEVEILNDYSLKAHNTFGIDVNTKYFTSIKSEDQLPLLIETPIYENAKILILGSGSNILFTKKFEGLVIKNDIQGIHEEVIGDDVFITVGGGMIWNDFVQYCVKNSYGGVENLSLIPGTVGASPVQNIGAYGVEISDVLFSCKAFDFKTGLFYEFTNEECEFGYRDSIFKNKAKGRYMIVSVTYKLTKQPVFKISYGAIREELDRMGIETPTIKAISDAVSTIRVNKLPDPSTIGNAGSFFKNPIISKIEFDELIFKFPEMVHYPAGNASYKIAAGWLIEQAGFKGIKIGESGTWKNQALVLVNYGNASGVELYNFSERIIEEVQIKFNIKLEREVNIF
ncbi:UDP-N-acetylmuramate dehydrogenase [Pedobacter flavus]|uniref:UDP-N-acetylenolpyruvoylglucosamine reductase n=1 Tax=Pedobacter flavus TaxID=3113906 RepID=A0ABU7GYM7_9SPHI|nr:UDP-N-acetylmuramate dehydrogenase [Pedobacter sp. VNH31]MEE1884127.1 UDP-N-acetylmuramate dehydrogenase [Pedobacter sp. VNH31]